MGTQVSTLDGSSGHTQNGLPYNRFGEGPSNVVIFQGLVFENKPMSGLDARFALGMYSFLESEYTVYVVTRRKGLPQGYTLKDMADDYAEMIEQEFDGPVDVIGTSTGGSICQPFAADHPALLRRLVIHSSAYKLGPTGKDAQLRARDLAREGKWRQVGAVMLEFVIRPAWYSKALIWLASPMMALDTPDDPSDLIVTIDAEDKFDFKDRLPEIAAATLVVAGAEDPGYTEQLFRETAAGIPDGKLILYPGMGHPARGKQFESDVLAFLRG
jgi:pimeloyl-ACP methyl ester carboxylesterase